MAVTHYEREPQVSVGIVSGRRISFSLNGLYRVNDQEIAGPQVATIENGSIHWLGKVYRELVFTPAAEGVSFSLDDVTIGVDFHWERKERQTFRGTLRLLADAGKLWAINRLDVESYLESVISSEMSATSNLPLLMAHAVISRSWLMAQISPKSPSSPTPPSPKGEGEKRRESVGKDAISLEAKNSNAVSLPFRGGRSGAGEALIRWFDHTDHTLFDVCADDHCQRYEGITKVTSENVAEAIRRTRGQILTCGDEICDARFSKCCGGAMEEFQYCWDDTPKPYLKGIGDTPSEKIPDLTIEANAEKWIRSTPESFCNTHDKRILSQVLNDYDQETTNFYRWQVEYTQDELSALVKKRTGIDFGTITDLVPMKRGTSGRISELKITGTKQTMIIGKELIIRRALSESHLYSSAFVVEKSTARESSAGVLFRLIGAGWGHGVGLCQIGAAVMGDKGYHYDEILKHYYPGAEIEKSW